PVYDPARTPAAAPDRRLATEANRDGQRDDDPAGQPTAHGPQADAEDDEADGQGQDARAPTGVAKPTPMNAQQQQRSAAGARLHRAGGTQTRKTADEAVATPARSTIDARTPFARRGSMAKPRGSPCRWEGGIEGASRRERAVG